jgi:lambda repressor-like predicted transcriptional regulator
MAKQQQAFTPTAIKIELLRHDRTAASIGRDLGVSRAFISGTVAGLYANPRARRAIAKAIGFAYHEVWGEADPGIDHLLPPRRAVEQDTSSSTTNEAGRANDIA